MFKFYKTKSKSKSYSLWLYVAYVPDYFFRWEQWLQVLFCLWGCQARRIYLPYLPLDSARLVLPTMTDKVQMKRTVSKQNARSTHPSLTGAITA